MLTYKLNISLTLIKYVYTYMLVFILATFLMMECVTWFTHKYVMHGFLWNLHEDHHKKDHDSWFERNDAFFIFYAK